MLLWIAVIVFTVTTVHSFLLLDMTDSFGDGWNGAEYYIYDLASGALAAQGSLDAAYGGDGVSSGYDLNLSCSRLLQRSGYRRFFPR